MEETKDLEEAVAAIPNFLDVYPKLACELAHLRFCADGVAKKEHLKQAWKIIKQRGLLRIARDLWPLRKVAL
jgi:predicted DsbA family dithiol-disulfide isomerase